MLWILHCFSDGVSTLGKEHLGLSFLWRSLISLFTRRLRNYLKRAGCFAKRMRRVSKPSFIWLKSFRGRSLFYRKTGRFSMQIREEPDSSLLRPRKRKDLLLPSLLWCLRRISNSLTKSLPLSSERALSAIFKSPLRLGARSEGNWWTCPCELNVTEYACTSLIGRTM